MPVVGDIYGNPMNTNENSLQTLGRLAGKALRIAAWGLAGYGVYRIIKDSGRIDDLGHETGFFHPGGGSVEDTVLSNETCLGYMEEIYGKWMSCKRVLDSRKAPLEHYLKVAEAELISIPREDGTLPEMCLSMLCRDVHFPTLEQKKRLDIVVAEANEWTAKYDRWKVEQARATLLKN